MDTYSDGDATSTPSFRYRWDVFLSFRGEDTRHTFTENLYRELIKHGVRTFRDDEELQRGDEIAPSLLDAIEDSAAAIAVISKRYADSRWCLEELARIIECRRLLLLPVFHQVDPSDVRKQTGPFERDFKRLEERFGVEKVGRWRNAMNKAGGISGWDSKLWEDEKLIESLVKNILTKLSNTPLGIPKHPVGLDSRLQELMNMLDIKGNGVKVMGIYGMGGAGKSTLAKALFNKLVMHFERRSFISNIRETSNQKDGLDALQKRLIRDLSPDSAANVSLREVLQTQKPVLIVLDDIDDTIQLHLLAGKRRWIYEGSRIIITTRDIQTIRAGIVDVVYEMRGLDFPEAVQLFSYHAFGREKPLPEFADISQKIVSRTGNLPLALEVFGSSLFDKRTKNLWVEAFEKLEQNPPGPGRLQEVLEISFNGLDDQQKCAFLDIACFFIKQTMEKEEIVYVLKGYGFAAETLIRDLAAKSLIKIIENDFLWIHDQLRDMGRRIVQRESPDPGNRSRLWDFNDILSVLKNEKGTRNIQGIALDIETNRYEASTGDIYWMNFRRRPTFNSAIMYLKEIYKNRFHNGAANIILKTESFKQMVNLRYLQINDVVLNGNFKQMPAEVKFLQWRGCSLENLPSEFCMQHLAVLDLSHSKIRKLWKQSWCTERLLLLNLQNCYHLTALPDLSVHSALEKLILENCKALVQIHKSVGDLKKLIHLNLKGCSNLTEFPSDVSGLKLLEILDLTGCPKIKQLPDDMRSMKNLRELLLDETAIVKLPDSIFHLKELRKLSLKGCWLLRHVSVHIGKLTSLQELSLDSSGLEEIPDSIGSLSNLEILNLARCKSLIAIPDSISNLESLIDLRLGSSSIEELPASIGSLCHLKSLSVSHCQSLSKLPDSIGGLASLVELWLEGTSVTEIPDQVGTLSMLRKLHIGNCMDLRFLPESIGKMLNLTTLILDYSMISELPESIEMLESLSTLMLNKCKQLQRLPASIGNLKRLQHLYMEETSVSELPDEMGMLSNLMIWKMRKPHTRQLQDTASVLPKSLSNLSLLEHLDACGWAFFGAVPDEFDKLSSLQTLNFSHNSICCLPSRLRGLSILKNLILADCKQLKSLPLLPSSLVNLIVANCNALESVCDLANLQSLQDLDLTNCNKIMDIPGLECLKSLRRLYMTGCFACFPAVKKRLAKVALKRLLNLSMPGRVLPNWFVQEIPRFSTPKNLDIKGIIVGIVVSLDQQTSDRFRDELPAIVDVQAKICRLEDPIYTTTLKLRGVPNTDEDQLYLCRYFEFHSLVFMLKEGDKIQITVRERPYFNGLRLKKYGIHLIFENDDDIDDADEESLDESQWSVSWKLAKFIGSLE
ncbi:leucine-rich repeat containing protein, putative [Ricinus communis]|uniref:Leucine-rich repeat containing protein, putative n=1 Tax=Ricinus communis TaxID=3988 RepID=B9S2G3_RICCO|nr:leucine-rich repeat containing protein, putative [Ricinus communis]